MISFLIFYLLCPKIFRFFKKIFDIIIQKEERTMKVPKELLEEAKEQELDIRDYLDTLCDDQFGLSYEEAVEQGLAEQYDFE